MSRATHADPAALVAACVMAACASWALEGASSSMLLEAAVEEAREAAREVDTEARLAEMLTQVSVGRGDRPAGAAARDRSRRWPRCCGARPGPRPCAAGW